jgi:hypothetical protein
MSVLALGDDLVKHRRVVAEYSYALRDWFVWAEMHAWARVNAYCQSERPKEIFLVVGQYLSTDFAIAHKKYGSLECEVILEATAEIPSVVDARLIGSYGITKAHSTVGFDTVIRNSSSEPPAEYSVFLHTYGQKSGPFQRFKTTLKSRVEEQYQ